MERVTAQPIANGLRTDHPIPDLPFVDDSHIPIEDAAGVEAVGRHDGTDMWGREDSSADGGWTAFTTDPRRHDLAWSVRWHPEHGRSVVLYRDEDVSGLHMALQDTALLFRSGGYWWDGSCWYRPPQIWDGASEDYLRRPVPAATTIAAADLLQNGGDPDRATVLSVGDIDLHEPASTVRRWSDDLAIWAARRRDRGHDAAELSRSVVSLTAPELSGDQLIGIAELAAEAGVAPSTLRAYLARGESEVPSPQAVISGRSVWSRAVAAEWVEQRRSEDLGELVAGVRAAATEAMPAGVRNVQSWFSRLFFDRLWRNPERRRRWALRARNETAVQAVADDLGRDVAVNLRQIVPLRDLASALRHAVLDEFRTDQDRHRSLRGDGTDPDAGIYALGLPVGRLLGWLILHDPNLARTTIGEIVGEAERKLAVARADSAWAIRCYTEFNGGLDATQAADYFDHVLNPLIEGAPTGSRP